MFTLDENEDAVGYGRLIYKGRYFGLPIEVIQEIKRLQANSSAYVQFLEEVQRVVVSENQNSDTSISTDGCVCVSINRGTPLTNVMNALANKG